MSYGYYDHYGNETSLLCENVCEYDDRHILYLDGIYNIILPEHNNMIIEMDPLPKSLYILFLRHPEGIQIKNISDYRYELECIYRSVSRRNNPTVIKRVIEEVTIPLNNTIYKNISLIRAAFYNRLAVETARHFVPIRRNKEDNLLTLDCTFVQLPIVIN